MPIKDMFNTLTNVKNNTESSIADYLTPAHYVASNELPVGQVDRKKFLNAIASNETGIVKGNAYASSQPSGYSPTDMALGRYRVTAAELASYGKKYLGKNVTPQQFLNSAQSQDDYMYNKAQHLANKGYTLQDIADIHNKGIKHSYPPNSGQYQSPDYVNKFTAAYNSQ